MIARALLHKSVLLQKPAECGYRSGPGRNKLRDESLVCCRSQWKNRLIQQSPAHLFVGTTADNNRDMTAKGRNGVQLHPERYPRGTNHYAHLHPETQRGERNGRAKLSAAQVIAIRSVYSNGDTTYAALALHYGVTSENISGIVRGIYWKHLL